MDRKVRIAVAAAVLLVGVLGAMMFRRGERPAAPRAAPADHLVLRREGPPSSGTTAAARPGSPTGVAAAPSSPRPSQATHVAAADAASAPPFMATEFPGPPAEAAVASLPDRDWVPHLALKPRTHRIADGDTLERLAEKYLGSAQRAGEIYEANRSSLSNPGVLPVGLPLVIPAPRPTPAAEGNLMPKAPLVPIASPKP